MVEAETWGEGRKVIQWGLQLFWRLFVAGFTGGSSHPTIGPLRENRAKFPRSTIGQFFLWVILGIWWRGWY